MTNAAVSEPLIDSARRELRALIAVAGLFVGALSCAAPSGYAALVRRVAPSVVTILVVDERVNAANRAADRAERRAAADADPTAMNAIIRRLLSAPGGD